MQKDTKIVVTHRGALESKYGRRLARVDAALARLVAADAQRGLGTRIVALDSASQMRPFGTRPMRGPDDERGAKRCIDAIDKALSPHYFLILGGPDVVPMPLLENPAGVIVGKVNDAPDNGDADPNIPSDLPYACDAPYSKDPGDFQGPTRVVGRLPDVPCATDPAFLVKAIDLAATAVPLPRAAYGDWLGLTARIWRKSTQSTLERVFGQSAALRASPPQGDRWSAQALQPRLHYINCHGGRGDTFFYGEALPVADERGEQVAALGAPRLRGRVTRGTVAVAQCCYGAQVFSPRRRDGARREGTLGIALEYLRQGAYGFFGSTTIAYGPEDTNDDSDVLCGLFLERVRAGCSLGRATLEARAGYLKFDAWNDPTKLKTLAQFYLLGDPSIHPIAPDARHPAPDEPAIAVDPVIAARQRARRRAKARREGIALQEARTVFKDELARVPEDVQQEIWRTAEKLGMRSKVIRLLALLAGAKRAAQGDASETAKRRARRVAFLVGEIPGSLGGGEKAGKPARDPRYVAIVVRLRGSTVVGTKRVVSR